MSFKKIRDLVLGIVMLLFSGFYLFFAQQIKTRPKLTPSYASAKIMPTLLGILLAVLSVVCIIQGIRQMKAKNKEEEKETKKASKGDMMAVLFTFAVITRLHSDHAADRLHPVHRALSVPANADPGPRG